MAIMAFLRQPRLHSSELLKLSALYYEAWLAMPVTVNTSRVQSSGCLAVMLREEEKHQGLVIAGGIDRLSRRTCPTRCTGTALILMGGWIMAGIEASDFGMSCRGHVARMRHKQEEIKIVRRVSPVCASKLRSTA
jgi:hypothetical protein